MLDERVLDDVALAVATTLQPARASALLKSSGAPWPAFALDEALARLRLDTPGLAQRCRGEARQLLERATALGCAPLCLRSSTYPPWLAETVDPPRLLWVRGDPLVLLQPAVAIVGSRRASPAGRDVAFRLGADLAACGIVVASGFAQGVDASAHRGALTTGRSVAVLGCGHDQAYPRDHADLARALAEAGAVVSEFAPGTPPRAHHFPLRNRILSGLSRAVVVVEASERSGSLITARLALEQGREVMAVPGDVRAGRNAGGHKLLRDGARLVESAADVLDELGWMPHRRPAGADPAGTGPAPAGAVPGLLGWLTAGGGATLDDLVLGTARSSTDLLGELLDLELAGLVRRDEAGRFLPAERKW